MTIPLVVFAVGTVFAVGAVGFEGFLAILSFITPSNSAQTFPNFRLR